MSDPEEADRIIQLEDALRRIKQWAEAYPVTVFSPVTQTDLVIAAEVLKGIGVSMDALHAAWARHILNGVVEICEEGLKP